MDNNLEKNKFSVAITSEENEILCNHLIREDGQEDICFALYNPSSGYNRVTAIIDEIILPQEGEREVHGNVSFLPSYFERVLLEALSKKKGIILLHSHPLASKWQGMSEDDFSAELGISRTVFAATKLPLVGMTISGLTRFWSGRFWVKNKNSFIPNDCEHIRVIGKTIKFYFCPLIKNAPEIPIALTRTINSWGERIQFDLARLRIGIVGLGSVGSLVSECLSRTGFTDVKLIDFDILKKHNLDRTLNATKQDVDSKNLKVDVAKEAALTSATMDNYQAESIPKGIQDQEAYLKALDCDILFSCVDRPWARSILNFIAKVHLIPVIDGGIGAFRKKNGELRTAEWGVHTILPQFRCLECLGQFQSSDVALERDGFLDDPQYIESLPDDSPYKRNENVFIFSMALASDMALECIKLFGHISGKQPSNRKRFVYPHSIIDENINLTCDDNCSFKKIVGLGNNGGHPGLD